MAFTRSASNVLVQCKKRLHELDTFQRLFETLSNPFDELNNFVKLDFDSFILGHFGKGLLIVAACKFALVI